jgi:hypothetical protein
VISNFESKKEGTPTPTIKRQGNLELELGKGGRGVIKGSPLL